LLKVRLRDSIGVGVTQAKLSRIPAPETITELFYIVEVNKYFSLEPDIQYVNQAAATGRDTLLGGIRLALRY
jgi:carbohydrate-selective porin OprB